MTNAANDPKHKLNFRHSGEGEWEAKSGYCSGGHYGIVVTPDGEFKASATQEPAKSWIRWYSDTFTSLTVAKATLQAIEYLLPGDYDSNKIHAEMTRVHDRMVNFPETEGKPNTDKPDTDKANPNGPPANLGGGLHVPQTLPPRPIFGNIPKPWPTVQLLTEELLRLKTEADLRQVARIKAVVIGGIRQVLKARFPSFPVDDVEELRMPDQVNAPRAEAAKAVEEMLKPGATYEAVMDPRTRGEAAAANLGPLPYGLDNLAFLMKAGTIGPKTPAAGDGNGCNITEGDVTAAPCPKPLPADASEGDAESAALMAAGRLNYETWTGAMGKAVFATNGRWDELTTGEKLAWAYAAESVLNEGRPKDPEPGPDSGPPPNPAPPAVRWFYVYLAGRKAPAQFRARRVHFVYESVPVVEFVGTEDKPEELVASFERTAYTGFRCSPTVQGND